ncbi:MAG: mechanosensitive ion channel family protein [Nannocystaceae bacterium]|nr:mechanosensitive ion channel family protein [bacterium]
MTGSLVAEAAPDVQALGQLARVIKWGGVFTSLFVILGAALTLRFLRQFVDSLSQRFPNRRLLLQKVATFAQFLLYVGTTLTVIFLSVELSDSIIALIGGTIAVSVGFAIKDLVASFIAGIMIMIDRPFQVGDRISFGGEYGDITAIGLRSVRLQTLGDNTVTIPNNKFLSDMTSNGNYGALDMQCTMDFFIAPDQDVRRARELASECAVSSRYTFLEKPVVVLVNQVITENYLAVRLRVKAYVLDTRYEKAFETDVNMRVMDAFAEEGIMAPAIVVRTAPGPGKASMIARASARPEA